MRELELWRDKVLHISPLESACLILLQIQLRIRDRIQNSVNLYEIHLLVWLMYIFTDGTIHTRMSRGG